MWPSDEGPDPLGVRNPDPERDETEAERSVCMLVSAGLDFGESGGVKKDEGEDEAVVAIESVCKNKSFFVYSCGEATTKCPAGRCQ